MDYKWNKIGVESISALSLNERSDLLELIILDLDGKKISGKTKKSENKSLTKFLENGIISIVKEKKRYWEDRQWYLNREDYEKLSLKFSKEQIDDLISRFDKWTGSSKLKRENIYLTINKWGKDMTKFILSPDQVTFIKKSYEFYQTNTKVPGDDFVKYSKIVEGYFKKGIDPEELREYLKNATAKELYKTSDAEFRKRSFTLMKDFEQWKKLRGG